MTGQCGFDYEFVIDQNHTVQYNGLVALPDRPVEELGWTRNIQLLRNICTSTPVPTTPTTSPSQLLKDWVDAVLRIFAALPDAEWTRNNGNSV
jgi:hypothetical protein